METGRSWLQNPGTTDPTPSKEFKDWCTDKLYKDSGVGSGIRITQREEDFIRILAFNIRHAAIQAPNTNTLSCAFGNWFVPVVENLIRRGLIKLNITEY